MKGVLKVISVFIFLFMIAASVFSMFWFIDNHYDVYRYKVRVIHCDGRWREVYITRRENCKPGAYEISARQSDAYIPTWRRYRNVCDLEIIEEKLIEKAKY